MYSFIHYSLASVHIKSGIILADKAACTHTLIVEMSEVWSVSCTNHTICKATDGALGTKFETLAEVSTTASHDYIMLLSIIINK